MNLDVLHNELRLRVPNKPYEFYNDALRSSIATICRKTSVWRIETDILTQPAIDVYDIDLPVDTTIHSNLYIIQRGSTDQLKVRPINGMKISSYGDSDWLQTFKTNDKESIQIFPKPLLGNTALTAVTSIKPSSSATAIDNDKFFEEYKDTVIYGALVRCYEVDDNIEQVMYNDKRFKDGVSSIHTDVIKEYADTPLKMSASW